LTMDLRGRDEKIAQLEVDLEGADKAQKAASSELLVLREELSHNEKVLSARDETIIQLKNGTKRAEALPSPEFSLPDLSDTFLSPAKSSPTATEIVTKHSELLQDLVKMKSIIRDAITPVKDEQKQELSQFDTDQGTYVSLLHKELDDKNKVLSFMEQQVDSLLQDISTAKKALSEKDDFVAVLEKERYDLIVQMKNMQLYLKQVEQSLCTELKRRRKLEQDVKLAKRENKSLLMEYQSKSQALGEAKKALTKKSRDVDEQVDVARQLAHQLQTTKNKIIALKAHLKKEGLLQDTTPKARKQHSSVRSTSSNKTNESTPSSASICWTFSED